MARSATSTAKNRSADARRRTSPAAVPGTAVEKAYDAIKREILANRLRPGDAIPVDQFVGDLRLSRTPVREATLRLQREGLIDIRPRLGTFVSHLDLRRIRDMYGVRRLLEGEAAREAALRGPVSDFQKLHDELAAFHETGEMDARGMSETGQRVHELIVWHCGNEVLRSMILSLQDHFTRFRSLSIQIPEKILSSHHEHLQILESLIAKDADRASHLVHVHFDHASQFLLDSLLYGSSASSPRVTIAFV
ncbi:MAG: GntR family transcriptional regulator [Bryobacteraceae bacterium]|nr:GntR family transcriptional regulator [Bryobacteraceae bacterium]